MWQKICFSSKGLCSFVRAAPQRHPKGQVHTQLAGAMSCVEVTEQQQGVNETGVRPGQAQAAVLGSPASPPGLPLGSHVLEVAPAVVVTSVPIGECPGGAQAGEGRAQGIWV